MKILINESQYKKILNEVSVKPNERVKLYEDDKILVVVPLTHKSSCKYGAHTTWCTATPSNDENFNDYFENGILVYFIIRSPHIESDIKEYKFAYYQAFNEDLDEYSGWYDMSDHPWTPPSEQVPEDGRGTPDMRLIKFLIPKQIFDLVKEYVKQEKPKYLQRMKESGEEFYNFFMNDPKNYSNQNVIVNDNDWFINFRIQKFDEDYYKYHNWYHESDNGIGIELKIYYVNKKTKEFYEQDLPYHVDIRISTIKDIKEFSTFYEINNHDKHPEMLPIFKKYYKQISEAYFKMRKLLYKPSERNNYIYLYPQFLEPGKDKPSSVWDNNETIISVTPSKGNRLWYSVDIKRGDGTINHNTYYSEDWGISVKYDKDRHNPI